MGHAAFSIRYPERRLIEIVGISLRIPARLQGRHPFSAFGAGRMDDRAGARRMGFPKNRRCCTEAAHRRNNRSGIECEGDL
jgi:hypothetical protein